MLTNNIREIKQLTCILYVLILLTAMSLSPQSIPFVIYFVIKANEIIISRPLY